MHFLQSDQTLPFHRETPKDPNAVECFSWLAGADVLGPVVQSIVMLYTASSVRSNPIMFMYITIIVIAMNIVF